jgi:hypothetical protein
MTQGRLRLTEITPSRVMEAFARRARAIPDRVAWWIPKGRSAKNRAHLDQIRNRHRGERCVILANGPSLADMDLSPLVDVPTFGMNRIYLLFDRLPFVPTYYVAINELVIEQFAAEIETLPIERYLNWNRRSFFSPDPATHFLSMRLGLRDRFSTDVRNPIDSGGTVTFVALQLAYHMGFREVVLIGLDHRFSAAGRPNRVEVRADNRDRDHFHPNYFPQGARWQLPDLRRSEMAYAQARAAFEKAGRRIVDATPGGGCRVFERGDFHRLVLEAPTGNIHQ